MDTTAPNSTMEEMVKAITDKIKLDPRVYGQDVQSFDQFKQPFDEWAKQAINQYMLPDYLRYQYNPYVQQQGASLANMNQNIGLTGAWRNAQSKQDLGNAAQSATLGQEQLNTGFNNQALATRDQLISQWALPLYESNMSTYYQAPWRNLDTGGAAANPTTTPTNPDMSGFNTPQAQAPANGAYTGVGNNLINSYGLPSYQMPTVNGSTDQGGNPRNLISQYLVTPSLNRR